ncbi:hypothetical protein BURK2_00575 [Burkholderiales bacterium]|nr:MAG: hypothetical protein F9K47_02085 [Burkholderiales bacterium]CAG0957968.1 hypothetical protein BURK2_00575 [Burkholderiales bacterium]
MRRILPRDRAAGVKLLRGLTLAAVLCAPPPLFAAESATTLWALNCRGCHLPPEEWRSNAPRGQGQFAQTEDGRIFFLELPQAGSALTPAEDARLTREILNWKTSCHVILQDAPLIRYTGARHVQ